MLNVFPNCISTWLTHPSLSVTEMMCSSGLPEGAWREDCRDAGGASWFAGVLGFSPWKEICESKWVMVKMMVISWSWYTTIDATGLSPCCEPGGCSKPVMLIVKRRFLNPAASVNLANSSLHVWVIGTEDKTYQYKLLQRISVEATNTCSFYSYYTRGVGVGATHIPSQYLTTIFVREIQLYII